MITLLLTEQETTTLIFALNEYRANQSKLVKVIANGDLQAAKKRDMHLMERINSDQVINKLIEQRNSESHG